MNVEECCATCKKCYTLKKWDFTDVCKNGIPKTEMEGFVCTAFSDEGIVIWLVGTAPEVDRCESYVPKEDT